MAKVKILSPNRSYTGISAGVDFLRGVGETNDPNLIDWFKEHGYSIIEEDVDLKPSEKKLEEMAVEELVAYAEKKSIDIGKATTQSGIMEKIKAAITNQASSNN